MATAPRVDTPPPRRPHLPYQTPRDTWDRDSCLAALKDWAQRFGRPPRAYEWSPPHGRAMGLLDASVLCEWERSHPRWPSTGTVRRHCGSWWRALAAAGLSDPDPSRPDLPLPDRVATACRLSVEGASHSTIADLLSVHPRTVAKYLKAATCPGCGGPIVTDGAGLCATCDRRRPKTRFSAEAFTAALGAWVQETGGQPSWRDWSPTYATGEAKWAREHPRWPPASVANTLFGSWRDALVAAGLQPKARGWTDGEIIEAVAGWAGEGGGPPRWEDWRHPPAGYPSAGTVTRRFGSWAAALRAAGLEPDVRRLARWNEETVLHGFDMFVELHGREPNQADFARSDARFPDPTTVARVFGSWSAALAAR